LAGPPIFINTSFDVRKKLGDVLDFIEDDGHRKAIQEASGIGNCPGADIQIFQTRQRMGF
jgi:hypothetical protein